MKNEQEKELFEKLRDDLMAMDPVWFVEKYLTLDGNPFKLSGNGYKPLADIYRYIGVKALEPNGLPVIVVKGRQVGMTTCASALEMYFMGCGLFGSSGKPPIRVIHAWPQLELAAAYSKTKLSEMINKSVPAAVQEVRKDKKPKTHMGSLLDQSSPTNDSLTFKQFVNGNHLWIESIGLDGDRVMGRQLCLETELPTPNGFIKLKDLKEGDDLFDEQGNVCQVTKLHPINLTPEAYKITFDDGTTVDACSEHLWKIYIKGNIERIKNTKFIYNNLNKNIEIKSFISGIEQIFKIISVEKIESKPMRCITVNSSSHLFLITKSCIPTHNTADVMFFDECFPSYQQIATNQGKKTIGSLVKNHLEKKENPLILSFNEEKQIFEYKKITNAWKKGKRQLIKLSFNGKKIECTPNHKFLTEFGWKEAKDIEIGTLIKSHHDTNKYVRSLNNDQYQIILGSFLGDGHISNHGNSKFRLKVIHGKKQKDYCNWLAEAFDCKINYIKENGFSKNEAFNFTTKLFGLNRNFPKTKNSCPQWILDEIDLRGIAIWFMDDGSITRRWKNGMCATISTCSFDEDSQKRFVKKFESLNIKCKYKKYSNNYYLIFNKLEIDKLLKLISPYMHSNLNYKTNYETEMYNWNFKENEYNWLVLDNKENLNYYRNVYDIEVEDNHNFVISPNTYGKNLGGPIAHNCQKTTDLAIGNSLKVLTTAKYGNKGVQVFFGTPRKKGSSFHKRWQMSTQQYYHLGCENCDQYFPLYTPGSNDWEKIWLRGYIVKCTHCGHEQDKLKAQDRGKWFPMKSEEDEDTKLMGFHINQLYMPMFTKEDIVNEQPGIHPINTERVYQNEVLGEFFQGDSSPITVEEIRDNCADIGRKFSGRIDSADNQIVVLGIDYGAKSDLENLANPDKIKNVGQSYSTAVILSVKGPGLLHVEFATKFKRNDPESKKALIEKMMRQYSVNLAVGDIGYSNDFSYIMNQAHGERYIVSRAHSRMNNHVKFDNSGIPEITFERDFYIGELYDQMKKGMIRFPYGDYEKVAWLVEHCASMDIKPSISRAGEPSIHYVKGGTPNDGFMALLNAYLAYKFLITKGFTNNGFGSNNQSIKDMNKPLVCGGYISRRF